MTWLAFSLIAASCWAAVQLIDKTLIVTEAPSPNHYLFLSGLASIPAVLLLPLVLSHSPFAISRHDAVFSAGAGACYFLSNALFFRALVRMDVSIASAALAVVPGSAAIGSWLVLGQHISVLPAAGIVVITVGVLIMSVGSGDDDRAASPHVPASAWVEIAGAAGFLVIEYIIEGDVVGGAGASSVFYWTRIGVTVATAVFAVTRVRQAQEALQWALVRSRKVGALSIGNETLDMVAVACLIAAYARGPVGLATAVAYSNPALVFLATLVVNSIRSKTVPSEGDEHHRNRRVIGLVVVVAGVFLASA